MKLVLLCFALLLFLLAEKTAAHPACEYKSIRLKLTDDEGECQKTCSDFKSRKKGKCFAFVFNPEDETCDGCVFDHSDEDTKFEKCGVNSGILVNSENATDGDGSVFYGDYYDFDSEPNEDDSQTSPFDDYYDAYLEPEPEESGNVFVDLYNEYADSYYGNLIDSGCNVIEEEIGFAASKKKCKSLCAKGAFTAASLRLWKHVVFMQWRQMVRLFERAVNDNVCGSV